MSGSVKTGIGIGVGCLLAPFVIAGAMCGACGLCAVGGSIAGMTGGQPPIAPAFKGLPPESLRGSAVQAPTPESSRVPDAQAAVALGAKWQPADWIGVARAIIANHRAPKGWGHEFGPAGPEGPAMDFYEHPTDYWRVAILRGVRDAWCITFDTAPPLLELGPQGAVSKVNVNSQGATLYTITGGPLAGSNAETLRYAGLSIESPAFVAHGGKQSWVAYHY